MRICQLQLSNILSFPYVENIDDALEISFDSKLNIIIGGNGSGKSTVLEAINFIFKRVLFKPYQFYENSFKNTSLALQADTFRIDPEMQKYKSYFRLNPNWDTEAKAQTIKVTVELDDIDKENINILVGRNGDLTTLAARYTRSTFPQFANINGNEKIELNVQLHKDDDNFTISQQGIRPDILAYLTDYELLRELILLYNSTAKPGDIITPLTDTFTMLSAFRNYFSFSASTSLNQDPRAQLRGLRHSNYNRGLNISDGSEPTVFSVVKIKLASHQFELMQGKKTLDESISATNKLDLIKQINGKLKIINLKCSIKLVDARSWSYIFEFYDTKHKRVLGDINQLSAGQKSIIHLIFEAYGRDAKRGGVVIIDEPEIHLHYQFQYEYLRIMQDIINDQSVQYVLVTHSDGFISYDTAQYIKRFSLDAKRHSVIHKPNITVTEKDLVRTLDNKQSARVLFGNKVILVEGQDDRYFFRAVLDDVHPEVRQEISVYDCGSRDFIPTWKNFFEMFGITVYQIKDLDAAFKDIYNEVPTKLETVAQIAAFKSTHSNLNTDIDTKYQEKLYILKEGPLEKYMGLRVHAGIEHIINYCKNIQQFTSANTSESKEVLRIIEEIVKS